MRKSYKFSHIVTVLARKIIDTFAAKPLRELIFEEVATAAMALKGFLIFPSASRTAPTLLAYWLVRVTPFIVNLFLATCENVAAF